MSEAGDRLTEGLDETETRLAQNAAIGEQIGEARDRPAFLLLFGTARDKALLAAKALRTVNPRDWRVIERLQNDVRRYDEMAAWVRAAVVEGEQAFQQLVDYRGEDGEDDTPNNQQETS